MNKLSIYFVSTGKVVELNFPEIPRMSDVFEYKGSYYMVADYDGILVHVVKINKHVIDCC